MCNESLRCKWKEMFQPSLLKICIIKLCSSSLISISAWKESLKEQEESLKRQPAGTRKSHRKKCNKVALNSAVKSNFCRAKERGKKTLNTLINYLTWSLMARALNIQQEAQKIQGKFAKIPF